VLRVELAVGDDLREHVHDFGVRANRVRRYHVDIREADGLRNGLAAGQQLFAVPDLWFIRDCHVSLSKLHDCSLRWPYPSTFAGGAVPSRTSRPVPVTCGKETRSRPFFSSAQAT